MCGLHYRRLLRRGAVDAEPLRRERTTTSDAMRCSRCGETKPIGDFHKDSRAPQGVIKWCQVCFTDYNTNYARTHRSSDVTAADRSRDARYRKMYDMTADEYATLLDYQEGVCAICGTPPKRIRLAVDHDHKTGEVRGLLCGQCNRRLSEQIGVEWLSAAYDYLDTPGVVVALGRVPVGRIGRVTTKRRRRSKKGLTK